jgi:non-ribosomal peptide synthetase component F
MHRHIVGMKLSIGVPTPNNRVYILDENLKPLSMGSTGIMWAAGKGISLGYINRTDLTSQKFLRDPFWNDGYVREYFTWLDS